MTQKEIHIVEQSDGRWFGNVRDRNTNERLLDEHGNHIECFLDSPKEVLDMLLEDIRQYDNTRTKEKI